MEHRVSNIFHSINLSAINIHTNDVVAWWQIWQVYQTVTSNKAISYRLHMDCRTTRKLTKPIIKKM